MSFGMFFTKRCISNPDNKLSFTLISCRVVYSNKLGGLIPNISKGGDDPPSDSSVLT